MKLRNFKPKISLTIEQWQALQKPLSKPLDDDGKDFILFFIEGWQREGRPQEGKSNGKIKKELTAFKNTADNLTKTAYNKLSVEAKNKILSAIHSIFCLQGWFDINNFYPHQVRYAAIVAIDELSCSKGRPSNKSEIKSIYQYWIFKIWQDLGETELTRWRDYVCSINNQKQEESKNSPLVEFSYQLFKLLGYTRSNEQIYKDICDYLIFYPPPLEPLQPQGIQENFIE